jgi:hypothetical protein
MCATLCILIYRAVIPKLYESATSSQGIRGFTNVMSILNFLLNFKIKVIIFC